VNVELFVVKANINWRIQPISATLPFKKRVLSNPEWVTPLK
jgi:hypothetical protein